MYANNKLKMPCVVTQNFTCSCDNCVNCLQCVNSGQAKHIKMSCYRNLQLPRTIKTIVNLHSMTCCYA